MSGQYAQAQKSMEDILSSIRETIEEDIKEGRRWINTPFGPAISPAPTADVLDLTQVVNDDGSLTTLTPMSSFSEQVSPSFQEAFFQENMKAPDLFLVEDGPSTGAIFDRIEPVQEETFSPQFAENVMPFSAVQTEADAQRNAFFEAVRPDESIDTPSFQSATQSSHVSQSSYISLQTPTPKQDFYYVAPEAQVLQMQEPAFVQPHEEALIMQSSPSKAATPEIILNADKEVDSIQRALEDDAPEEEAQELAQEAFQEEPQAEVSEEAQEEVLQESSPEPESKPVAETLLSKETFDASSQALAALTRTVVEQSVQEKEFSPEEKFGQQTVDELMQSILRPMLKDWLDAHLPSLVKWIVTEQIEKVMQQGLSTDKSTS